MQKLKEVGEKEQQEEDDQVQQGTKQLAQDSAVEQDWLSVTTVV